MLAESDGGRSAGRLGLAAWPFRRLLREDHPHQRADNHRHPEQLSHRSSPFPDPGIELIEEKSPHQELNLIRASLE